MKKSMPVLGVALLASCLILTGATVVDRSVQQVPISQQGSTSDQSRDDSSGGDTSPGSSGASSDSAAGGHGQSLAAAIIAGVGQLLGFDIGGSSDQTSGSGSGGVNTVNYRTMKIFGTNIAGLEFSGLFQANSAPTYAYFKDKGMNTVRLPFDWNELQPDPNGEFDATAKQYIDENIAWAKQQGMSVILDAHNYGRRYIYRDGGFQDDFASNEQHTFRIPYGDHDSSAGTLTFRDFGRGVAGTAANPVTPATGYRETFDMKIDSIEGSAWNEFYMDVFYVDEDNRYSLVANPVTNEWSLRQYLHGAMTTLASGSKSWTLGQYYTVAIDVNQAASGKINVSVDGTPLFTANSVSSNPALSRGKVAMFPSGVTATIRNYTLNVAGDTTSGGPIEQRVAEAGLPLSAWRDLWTKLSQAYKNEPAVLGYDHNEPHDMPVATAQNNYSYAVAASNGVSVATATAMGQSMVDAIRSTGDTKFVVVEMDHWANTHYFQAQYGNNPTPWISDTLNKVVYSGHYYFDGDHSGSYGGGSTPPTDATLQAEILPFFQWCVNRQVICYEGEFGVPNTTQWQPALTEFLTLMRAHDIWWTQWAGGDLYSSITTLQPANSYATDRLQMTTIRDFLK